MMCLRFVVLLITRVTAWLRLCRREDAWKIAEILILRHQFVVLQRQSAARPKLAWADRALLAALVGVMPKARRPGLRLLVTPDTILRWHRDIVRRRWATRSMHGRTGRPATRRNIKALVLRLTRENTEWGTAGSTASWPGWESRSLRRPYGRSSRPAASILPRYDRPGRPGRSSCALRPTQSWRATSSRPACPAAPRLTCWP